MVVMTVTIVIMVMMVMVVMVQSPWAAIFLFCFVSLWRVMQFFRTAP